MSHKQKKCFLSYKVIILTGNSFSHKIKYGISITDIPSRILSSVTAEKQKVKQYNQFYPQTV